MKSMPSGWNWPQVNSAHCVSKCNNWPQEETRTWLGKDSRSLFHRGEIVEHNALVFTHGCEDISARMQRDVCCGSCMYNHLAHDVAIFKYLDSTGWRCHDWLLLPEECCSNTAVAEFQGLEGLLLCKRVEDSHSIGATEESEVTTGIKREDAGAGKTSIWDFSCVKTLNKVGLSAIVRNDALFTRLRQSIAMSEYIVSAIE